METLSIAVDGSPEKGEVWRIHGLNNAAQLCTRTIFLNRTWMVSKLRKR